MADPFGAALSALHTSAGSRAAIYTPAGGSALPVRVIRSQGSIVSDRLVLDRDTVEIRAVDVGGPARGDTVQLLGTVSVRGVPYVDPVFRIAQDPLLDEEGLTWSCAIELA